MAHAQQQVLDAVVAAITAAATVAGPRVYLDLVDPLDAAQLPAVLVEEGDGGEQSEFLTLNGDQRRTLSVSVGCVLTNSSTAPADARQFGLAVEKALASSAALQALCRLGLEITDSRLVVNGDLDQLHAARQQSWRFSYRVNPEAPDLIF